VLVWDARDGVRGVALDALPAGRSAEVGLPAPTPEEFAARLALALAVSGVGLAAWTADFDPPHLVGTWLEVIADPQFAASHGYLDVPEAEPAG